MQEFSLTEEDYLKAIYHLTKAEENVSTGAIAKVLKTRDSSVSDMLKKLATKGVIQYVKYKGVSITQEGRQAALWIIRKHRLWEVFLVEKLQFNWDEVHDVAEQLEHIKSTALVERLDQFLGFPKFDPHGDPIPDAQGNFLYTPTLLLSKAEVGKEVKVVGVKDSSPEFLRYLDSIAIQIGSILHIIEQVAYDHSLRVSLETGSAFLISEKVSNNIYVTIGK